MSGPSYRLQTPRPRRVPSPLNFDSSFKPPSVLTTHHDSQTLLYDLPSATSISPPTSPRSGPRVLSPSSPSFPPRSRGARSGRPTPPPSHRNRSATPSGGVASSDLEIFAEHCRAWYFNQDDNSGRLMTQTLATLPPSQRAPFARIQASIRSAYHRSVNMRRHAEFQAQLSATTPGGSLLPHNRADSRSKSARKERYERMERFVRNWCNTGMPGTKPFFEALWAVMRLQVIPANLGGAGAHRIDWEFDDAVFKEAAGKDFMLEAIDFLKGVLAFEEAPSLKVSDSAYGHRKYSNTQTIHSRAQSQPTSHQNSFTVASTIQPKRPRAPSDPFLDAPQSAPFVSSSPALSFNPDSLNTSSGTEREDPPQSPVIPYGDAMANANFDDDTEEQYLRVWTSPDLSNSEYLRLTELFPAFITRRPFPRFPVPQSRHVDIEEGEDEGLEGRQIHFGTGSMCISSKTRTEAWEGGLWAMFISWWRKLFC